MSLNASISGPSQDPRTVTVVGPGEATGVEQAASTSSRAIATPSARLVHRLAGCVFARPVIAGSVRPALAERGARDPGIPYDIHLPPGEQRPDPIERPVHAAHRS